jgi:uncharacterized membrane protein
VDTSIPVGGTAVATGTVIDQTTGQPADPSGLDGAISWASGNESVFTVTPTDQNHADVVAVAAGSATLGAAANYLGQSITGSAQVTVTELPHAFAIDIQF